MYAAICLLDIIYVQEPPYSLCHDSFSSVRCKPGKVTFMLLVSFWPSLCHTTLGVVLRYRERARAGLVRVKSSLE